MFSSSLIFDNLITMCLVCSSLSLSFLGLSVLCGREWLFNFPCWGSYWLLSLQTPSQSLSLSFPSQFSLAQFSCSVVSDSLWPHESQHVRPPCPSPTPGVHSDSCPSSWWCHPAISSSVVPFSSCLQSLPGSASFPGSQLFAWGGQSIGVSALASVLPKNTLGWSPSEWTGWISLQSKGLSNWSRLYRVK